MLPRGLVGVVHLPPLPGDPRHDRRGSFAGARARALADADALARGGADALLVENFGSAPFSKGTEGHRLPPHQVATLALVAGELSERFDLPVGVNCLRNDAQAAVGIAAAAGVGFVRINVHVGACVTDQGLVEGEADRTLRYRHALGADSVAVLADVLVKHAAPLVPTDARAAAAEALDRGGADGLVVTGEATGAPTSRERLEAVREAAGERPVWIGSGLTPDNAGELAPLAHGAIVGSWLKQGADVHAPVDEQRVRALAAVLRDRLQRP